MLGNRDWTRIAVEAVREMAARRAMVTLPELTMKKYLTKATRGALEGAGSGGARGGTHGLCDR